MPYNYTSQRWEHSYYESSRHYGEGDSSDVCRCGLCNKTCDWDDAVPALFVDRICPACEKGIKRKKPRIPNGYLTLGNRRYIRDIEERGKPAPFKVRIKFADGRTSDSPLNLTLGGALRE